MKNASKNLFFSQDIQNFVFSSSPLFYPVGFCFRGWSKINLKVYDVVNCLNKELNNTLISISSEGKQVLHWNFCNW